MFKDTKEGQTNYCEACEYEAKYKKQFARDFGLKHTCGKENMQNFQDIEKEFLNHPELAGQNGYCNPVFAKKISDFFRQKFEEREEELLYEIGKNCKVAELKIDENDQLWARIDTSFSGKPKGEILLLDAEAIKIIKGK